MNKDYVSSVTLIVIGENLAPEAVTEALALPPSQSWKRGEKRTLPKGREHVYAWGGWKLFSPEPDSALPLEEQLGNWTRLLAERKEGINLLRASELSITLDCYIAVTSCATSQLNADLLGQLGELGVDIVLNLFKE